MAEDRFFLLLGAMCPSFEAGKDPCGLAEASLGGGGKVVRSLLKRTPGVVQP